MSDIPRLIDPLFCEQRGYHGPFANADRYNQYPDWQGFGDCMTCGSSRYIPTEMERWTTVEPVPHRGIV